MLKTISGFLLGAIVAGAVGAAMAVTGQAPVNGFGPVDGTWLQGLASGQNETYQYGISAAGTTQATATQLPAGINLMEIDTAAASSGVALPPCYQGTEFSIYNNGANTVTFYPNVINNPTTSAQDTINNSTSTTIATHTPIFFFCAKNGNWAAK